MKTLSTLFLVSCCLWISACSPQEKKIKLHIADIEKNIQITENGEDFAAFFKYFKEDTVFQFKRNYIPFEISLEYLPFNGIGELCDTIITSDNVKDWRPAYWLNDSLFSIERTRDTTKLIYYERTPYIELLTTRFFIMTNHKWYYNSNLTKLKNKNDWYIWE